ARSQTLTASWRETRLWPPGWDRILSAHSALTGCLSYSTSTRCWPRWAITAGLPQPSPPPPGCRPLTGPPTAPASPPHHAGFPTEQRGFPRVVGAFADLGAVEYGSGPVVTTTLDGGVGSLRYACAYAPNGSRITFDSSLSGQTITLTSGQITLSNNLTIDAS